mmetsp:Transcript_32603/g.68136  ORF Transcript_32603/g.68136 Transcript_32603/m.68136 type:complete len:106 (-) Transcript_32603:1073-1390(-)
MSASGKPTMDNNAKAGRITSETQRTVSEKAVQWKQHPRSPGCIKREVDSKQGSEYDDNIAPSMARVMITQPGAQMPNITPFRIAFLLSTSATRRSIVPFESCTIF